MCRSEVEVGPHERIAHHPVVWAASGARVARVKPLLKWAGGKSRLAPSISEAFGAPCTGTYFEPFIGSGSVFLHRRAAGEVGEAVISDFNPKLVAMHVAIRDAVDDVLAELERFPMVEYRAAYYGVRDDFNAGPHEGPRHAARFLWLNRAGFNGLYRENRSGGYNVPVGRYAKISMPSEEAFRTVSALLEGVDIRAGGYDDVMRLAGRGDQIYCDPPYVPLNQSSDFTAYCKSPFGLHEQRSLANEAQRAAFRGAQVVLSNHDLPLVRQVLYPENAGFRVVANPPVSRAISRSVNSRKPILEVIASIGPFGQAA